MSIRNLQNKSDTQKVFYAIVTSLSVAAVLLLVWGYNLINSSVATDIAGGASSIASAVEKVKSGGKFQEAVSSISQLLNSQEPSTPPAAEVEKVEKSGAAVKHKDAFDTAGSGDNPEGVL